jgi:hypothetical protein
MPVPYVSPRFQAIDASGNPLVGGKLYTYANTTTTPQATFQDAAGTINNTNPIILDGRGEAVIFLTENQSYTFVLHDAQDALIWSQDSIAGGSSAGGEIAVVTALPSIDTGPVYLAGQGIFSWNGTAYVSDYSMGFGGGAYSYRNKIMNGSFSIWQRGASVGPITSASPYTADGWQALASGTASLTVAQVLSSPDYGQARVGAYIAKITSNAASTPAAGDKNRFSQAIEGLNILGLALGSLWGGSFTYSFWVKSSIAGTYSVAFLNSGSPGFRSYISNYTVDVANAWELKSVTVPIDQSGLANWNRSTGVGMRVVFDLGSGATSEGVPDTWLTSESTRTTGSVRFVGTNAATLQFASAQLEIGTQATPFEDRPYALELDLCQRYYQRIGSVNSWAYSSAGGPVGFSLAISEMRVAPTGTFLLSPAYTNASNLTISTTTTNSLGLFATVTALGSAAWTLPGIALNASL